MTPVQTKVVPETVVVLYSVNEGGVCFAPHFANDGLRTQRITINSSGALDAYRRQDGLPSPRKGSLESYLRYQPGVLLKQQNPLLRPDSSSSADMKPLSHSSFGLQSLFLTLIRVKDGAHAT